MFGPLRYGGSKYTVPNAVNNTVNDTDRPRRSLRAIYVRTPAVEAGVFVLRRRKTEAMDQAAKDAAAKKALEDAKAAKAIKGTGFGVFSSILGIKIPKPGDPEKGADPPFSERIEKAYSNHTYQYWFVATLANGLLFAQIIIGAALTACGASSSHSSRVATIYLGVASTVIAGLLTYFKSRNQPNRARQFRQALKGVQNKMRENASLLKASGTAEEGETQAREVYKMYEDALKEAETNYPDLWVTMTDLKRFLGSGQSDSNLKGMDPNSEEAKELKRLREIEPRAARGLGMVGNVGPHAGGVSGGTGSGEQMLGNTSETGPVRPRTLAEDGRHDTEEVRDQDVISPASPNGTTMVASDTDTRQ